MKKNNGLNRKEWMVLIQQSINELTQQQAILLKRGDLFGEKERGTYRLIYDELCKLLTDTLAERDLQEMHRYLQVSVFMPNESFLMDLFETNHFPLLFELFEYE